MWLSDCIQTRRPPEQIYFPRWRVFSINFLDDARLEAPREYAEVKA